MTGRPSLNRVIHHEVFSSYEHSSKSTEENSRVNQKLNCARNCNFKPRTSLLSVAYLKLVSPRGSNFNLIGTGYVAAKLCDLIAVQAISVVSVRPSLVFFARATRSCHLNSWAVFYRLVNAFSFHALLLNNFNVNIFSTAKSYSLTINFVNKTKRETEKFDSSASINRS